MAVLVNPADDATMQATLREVGSAAGYLGLETMTFNASSSQEILRAGRWMTTPTTMAATPLSPSNPQVTARRPGNP